MTGPWWVSFEEMLTTEERDEIGVSEDRGAVVCITRPCSAYSELRQGATLPSRP